MRVRYAVARGLLRLSEAFATLSFFVAGDYSPPAEEEEQEASGVFDVSLQGSTAAVTLSDEARRMLADGAARNPANERPAPRAGAPLPPLEGSAAWRASRVKG